ncbi:MAG: hypothetical protein ACKVQR_04335 [Aquabacterium sp.]
MPQMAAWWRAHQHALTLLSPADLAEIVAIKDRRKSLLQHAEFTPATPQHQPRLV